MEYTNFSFIEKKNKNMQMRKIMYYYYNLIVEYVRGWLWYAETSLSDSYIYDDFVELMEIEPFLPQ